LLQGHLLNQAASDGSVQYYPRGWCPFATPRPALVRCGIQL